MAKSSGLRRGARSVDSNGNGREFPLSTGQTNAALAANGAALIAVLGLLTPEVWESLLGQAPPPTARAIVVVGVATAWALVIGADLIARAYTSAHDTTTTPTAPTASPSDGTSTAPSPRGGSRSQETEFLVTVIDGEDTYGWKLYSVSGDRAVIYKPGEPIRAVPLESLRATRSDRNGTHATVSR